MLVDNSCQFAVAAGVGVLRHTALVTEEQPQQRGLSLEALRFHQILANVEQELQNALSRARLESDHTTTIGDGAEEPVRNVLRGYLPSGYGVGKGHVYDAYGDGSRQTDVVITNPDHPLSFPEGRSGTYVVDGVSAAGEVKSRLDVAALDDCIEKGKVFKQLRMTVNESDHVMTAKEQGYMKQIGLVPPFFALAFENKIATDTIGKRLQDAGLVPPPPGKSMGEADWADTPQPPLDAVCILGRGVWLYVRPDNPMGMKMNAQFADGSVRSDLAAWAFLEIEAPLAWLLAWLNASMPRIFRGTSVFRPYLIPPTRHVKYMNARNGASDTNDETAPVAQAEGGDPTPLEHADDSTPR